MSLKILGFILPDLRIKLIIIIILIIIILFLIEFNLPLLITIFLLKRQHNSIITTLVTLLINKSFFQKPVTSPHRISEMVFHILANKLLSCPYSTILLLVQQK